MPPKPKNKRSNRVGRIMDNTDRRRQLSVAPSPSPVPAAAQAKGSSGSSEKCRNCGSTDIQEGACADCGLVLREHDIVAEITFGETSNGAATVQGSYLGATQGGVRPTGMGLSFRRVPGAGLKEARERAERETRDLCSQMVHQLSVPLDVADTAMDIYREAVRASYVKGRRKHNVAAVCMYAACRLANQKQIMLLDLADIVKTDVFLLGRNYKELMRRLPTFDTGYDPLTLENLIFRFAAKLEFLHDTNKVANSALRIAHRMVKDNISIGRRPAGISGAAIIMAARAHNFRRTVREVVYVAKVTMATLQERMSEFAAVPAASLSIKQFMQGDEMHPEASHDPPVVYKQSREWLEKHPKRARKRKASDNSPEDPQESDQQSAPKCRRTSADADTPDSEAEEASAPHVDSDGFVIPPNPNEQPKKKQLLTDHEGALLIGGLGAPEDGLEEEEVEALHREFYEDENPNSHEYDASSEMAMAQQQGIAIPGMKVTIKPRAGSTPAANGAPISDENATKGVQERPAQGKRAKPTLAIDFDSQDDNIEADMEGLIEDPAIARVVEEVTRLEQQLEKQPAIQVSKAILDEETPAAETSTQEAPAVVNEQPGEAPLNTPSNEEAEASTSPAASASNSLAADPLLDPIIREDEFEDDPEVMFCRLSEEDSKVKSQIWYNQNKDWLRQLQQKTFEAKIARNKPKKKSQGKKARIGEGQSGPAASASEAMSQMLANRALVISTKLNYGNMDTLFSLNQGGPGSAGTQSGMPSAAASNNGAGDDEEMPDDPAPAQTAGDEDHDTAAAYEEEGVEEDYQHHEEETYEQEDDEGDYDQGGHGPGFNPWDE
ncbi:transcription factor TFIIIB subunit brf1 [Podospora pseudopauciseta]|uniref:Transcription factor TFIIIB subunit brf1 n=1 Tax=Podospora pseudopauciseta TaxID=2093780 RepID=A0ABR0H5L2_9PEZI|nr:transcription factor TFIIIB subunit brf1 [Podospora pseudopauciseta]